MPARLARCICSSCSTRRSSTCLRSTFCGGSSSFCSRRRSHDDDHLLVEFALQHHAFVDGGGDAVEQHTGARGLARLGVGALRQRAQRRATGRPREKTFKIMELVFPGPEFPGSILELCVPGKRRQTFRHWPVRSVPAARRRRSRSCRRGWTPSGAPRRAAGSSRPCIRSRRIDRASWSRTGCRHSARRHSSDLPMGHAVDASTCSMTVALRAIREIHHVLAVGPVLQAELRALGVLVFGIPLHARFDVPVLVRGERDLRDEVGGVARRRRLVGQHHARLLEVVSLADAHREVLRAAGGIQQPAGEADGDLVGVIDAIGAHVSDWCDTAAPGSDRAGRCRTAAAGLWSRNGVYRYSARGSSVRRRWPCEPELRSNTSPGVERRERQRAGRRVVGSRRPVVERILRVAIAHRWAARNIPAPTSRSPCAAPRRGASRSRRRRVRSSPARRRSRSRSMPSARVPVARGQQARRARVRPVFAASARRRWSGNPGPARARSGARRGRSTSASRSANGHAGALGPLREVLEVVGVADVGGVDAEAPLAGQLGHVLEREAACGSRSARSSLGR